MPCNQLIPDTEENYRLNLAKALAAFSHKDQVDKSGKPYILHPMAVAAQMETEDEKITALLHDVLEDTSVTRSTIQNLFGKDIADAVDTLTRRDEEDYFAYIHRVSKNPLSRKVKLADLQHNMDLSRLDTITERDLKRVEKYKRAQKQLLAATEL